MTTLMTNGTPGYRVSGDVRVLTGEHVGAKPVACPQRERRGAFWGAKRVQTVIADVPFSMSASAFERSP
jgi:hypothetical protein